MISFGRLTLKISFKSNLILKIQCKIQKSRHFTFKSQLQFCLEKRKTELANDIQRYTTQASFWEISFQCTLEIVLLRKAQIKTTTTIISKPFVRSISNLHTIFRTILRKLHAIWPLVSKGNAKASVKMTKKLNFVYKKIDILSKWQFVNNRFGESSELSISNKTAFRFTLHWSSTAVRKLNFWSFENHNFQYEHLFLYRSRIFFFHQRRRNKHFIALTADTFLKCRCKISLRVFPCSLLLILFQPFIRIIYEAS